MFARKLRDGLLATAAAGALVLGAGSASALTVGSLLSSGGLFSLSDNSAEYLIKGVDPVTGVANTNPDVVELGDVLRGIASIDTVTKGAVQTGIGTGTAYNELTILFEIAVTNKVAVGGALSGGGTCTSLVCFEFGPTASFAAEVGGLGFANTAGAMAAFFEDPAQDFTRTILTDTDLVTAGTQTTPASIAADLLAMEASATGGLPFWLVGLDVIDDFWLAGTTGDNITLLNLLSNPTSFGSFNMGLSLLDNPTGPNLNPALCTDLTSPLITFSVVEFCANGGLQAKGPTDGDITGDGIGDGVAHINTAYDSLDDVNFNINVVPEPASLGLLGLGLLGLGFISRRRRNRQ